MKERCPICNNVNLKVIRDYHNHSIVYNDMQLIKCNKCKMVFASPMPSENEIELYNASYFSNAHGDLPKTTVAKAFFSGIARLRAAFITNYLQKENIVVNHVLEIGSGIVYFARNWLEKNPDTKYSVIETDSSCYDSLEKIGVKLIDPIVDKEGKELESVDLMIMSHVLEHVSNPVSFLEKITKRLHKHAVLFIEVPCGDWEHKHKDEPHLLFFDKEPMKRLLEKLSFENIQISYHGQEIEQLRKHSIYRAKVMAIRSKLISFGIIAPFSRVRNGMEIISDPLERAAVAPFKAHCESSKPAWWLRAIATKS